MSEVSRLFDLLKTELNDWTLRTGYYLELKHGLMGTFPALMRRNKRVVVCLTEGLMHQVASRLPARDNTIGSALFLVNEKAKVAFSLSGLPSLPDDATRREACYLLTNKEFEALVSRCKRSPFIWAPGLISSR